ncbi:SAM-dependent methyltransferase [Candidatus Peregrinibacteria bacterium]|nr:MAG: SAM-dependent methyltransferase [Candidatus Peregrinibacteria bacterium]
MNQKIQDFLNEIESNIQENTFHRLTISNPTHKKNDLKKIIIKLIVIKEETHLSFVYRYTTKDITKNFLVERGIHKIQELFHDFNDAILLTENENIELKIFPNKIKIIRKQTEKKDISQTHDKQKIRIVQKKDNVYLQELGILNAGFEIKKGRHDKFKQIDKYIEICDSLIQNMKLPKNISVMDMGSGKGYLTFALYDYLVKNNFQPHVTGVEFRSDMVKKCNTVAAICDFQGLHFQEDSIHSVQIVKNDILIALHACDTATDEAIAKGILSNSSLIICAPCCQKQIRKQWNPTSDFSSFLKHGILEERQAEIITDAIRSLILEMHGYKTKVFEFISNEHTAKNIMIVGQKTDTPNNAEEIKKKIETIKKAYGIEQHYLETLL